MHAIRHPWRGGMSIGFTGERAGTGTEPGGFSFAVVAEAAQQGVQSTCTRNSTPALDFGRNAVEPRGGLFSTPKYLSLVEPPAWDAAARRLPQRWRLRGGWGTSSANHHSRAKKRLMAGLAQKRLYARTC